MLGAQELLTRMLKDYISVCVDIFVLLYVSWQRLVGRGE